MAADRRFTEPRSFGRQASAQLTGTRLDWSKESDGSTKKDEDKKSIFAEETNMLGDEKNFDNSAFQQKYRPPYAPELDDTEMKLLTDFLREKEKRLDILERDPVYQFCILVAGLSNRDLDGVLVFQTKDHFMPFSDTKLPSTNFVKDVTTQRMEINKAIVDAIQALEAAITRNLIQNQIEKTAIIGDIIRTSDSGSRVQLFVPANSPIINTDLTRLLPKSPELKQLFERYMKYKDVVDEYFETESGTADFQTMKRVYETGISGVEARVGTISSQNPMSLFPPQVTQTMIFDMLFSTEQNTADNNETLQARRNLDDLVRYEAQLQPSSSRERMYAALKWAGKPEVVTISHLTPIMKGAVTLAIAKLRSFAPQFRNISSNLVKMLDNADEDFVSLLAKLVALHILETETEAPTRATLDRAENRIARKINKIVFSLKKFVVSNGKVTGYNPRASRLGSSALYAFPGGC
jgi:hypothetical protein